MRIAPRFFAFALAGTLVSVHANGQAARVPVRVRGFAFDSLRNEPLRNAFVTIDGVTNAATTDARGRFEIDGVLPGAHTVSLQHPRLDTLGIASVTAKANVEGADGEIRIAVPSYQTFWRRVCGTDRAPADSGYVFGVVRNARTGKPVAGATVDVTWDDIAASDRKKVSRTRYHNRATTNEFGRYAACGVSLVFGVRVRAATDSASSGLIDLPGVGERMQRRDLFIGAMAADSAANGAIAGLLTVPGGEAYYDALVLVDDSVMTRTGDNGRFLVRNVALGTHQVEVRRVGYDPFAIAVDVLPHDTASVVMEVKRVTRLSPMYITHALHAQVLNDELQDRLKLGKALVLDSNFVDARPKVFNALMELPSVRTAYRAGEFTLNVPDGAGGRCTPELRIDGAVAGYTHLTPMRPSEVALIEYYARGSGVPTQFLRAGFGPQCGLILIWTKWALHKLP
jgi:hypothetical protein